jgi:hypothetical protein
MTGLALITSALKTLNATAVEEDPTNAEAQDALLRLNDWIDSLALDDFTIYFLLRTVVALTASTASYTIGTGGAINISRPTEISAAGLILNTGTTPPQELPIDVFTDQQYENIVQKTYSSTYPTGIYYDHGWTTGLATIKPYPIPNQSLSQLVLYTPQALLEMTLTGDVTFPPGYRRFLRYGLARELAPEFGGWDEQKERIYLTTKQRIEEKNLRMSDLQVPSSVARSNIYTGTV